MNKDIRPFEQCPGCGSPTAKAKRIFDVLLLGEPCSVLQCLSCGLVYKELVPTASGLAKIYSANYVHFQTSFSVSELAEINSAKQKLARCRKLLATPRPREELRLLDVGCGSGSFVAIARRLGYSADGIDPYLPDSLESSYLQKQSPEDISASSYDIAVLLNVAEHLDEPGHMFSAVRQLLKPGGVMLLTCPYGDSLARRIHQASWGHLALDEHLLFWTPRSLTHLLRELGFHGKVSYRIAGSPFPYGRIKLQTAAPIPTETQHQPASNTSTNQQTLQARIWKLARAIQRQEATANFVRSLVHLSHSGDYLEYAIGVSK
jgi:2-polyprenyl-3-methyl-5-hydroxy-6-metoxy-1,4-benzoquinol methylase